MITANIALIELLIPFSATDHSLSFPHESERLLSSLKSAHRPKVSINLE